MTVAGGERVVARDEPVRQVEPRQLAAARLSGCGRKCGRAGLTTSPVSSIQLPRGRMRTVRWSALLDAHQALRQRVVERLALLLGAGDGVALGLEQRRDLRRK